MEKERIYEILNEAYFSSSPHEQEVLEKLPVLLEGVSIAVDCGASLGQYTKAIAHTLRGGLIHSIEAEPVRFEELIRNAEAWSQVTGAEIITYHRAVSDAAGSLPFFVINLNVSGGLSKHDTTSDVAWRRSRSRRPRSTSYSPTTRRGSSRSMSKGQSSPFCGAPHGSSRRGSTVFLVELHGVWGEGDGRDVLDLMTARVPPGVPLPQTVFTADAALRRRLLGMELSDPKQIKRRTRRASKRALQSLHEPVGRWSTHPRHPVAAESGFQKRQDLECMRGQALS